MSDGPRVALTFDVEHPDRPDHGEHAGRILDELSHRGVSATAFIQGRWAEANPGLARRWADEGHLVGSHTFYHARMPLLTEAGFVEDVSEAERVIGETTGVDPRPWLRFPFGAGADADDVVGRLPDLGYRHIGWHVEVYEWEPGRTSKEVEDRVVDGAVEHGDGAIVLLHTWPDPVLPALTEIVERLRAESWRFVRVDELGLPDDLTPVGVPQPGMPRAVT